MKLTKNINLLKKKEFLSIFGNIFEKSDWIADEVFNLKPFKDSNDLVIKMMNIYENRIMKKDRSSLLAFIIALPLILCLLVSSASGAKLYTGGEKYEKDKVVALLLHLNGKMIEWVYKENLAQCLKSKRVADREVNGERVIFSCKIVKALLQEDKQAKYGIRLLKVLD